MKLNLHLPLSLAALAAVASSQGFQQPPIALDVDPDPVIVEVDLTAAETTWEYVAGVQPTVWAYHGNVPGPTIRAKVGDTGIVDFTDDLPEETTIQWFATRPRSAPSRRSAS